MEPAHVEVSPQLSAVQQVVPKPTLAQITAPGVGPDNSQTSDGLTDTNSSGSSARSLSDRSRTSKLVRAASSDGTAVRALLDTFRVSRTVRSPISVGIAVMPFPARQAYSSEGANSPTLGGVGPSMPALHASIRVGSSTPSNSAQVIPASSMQ